MFEDALVEGKVAFYVWEKEGVASGWLGLIRLLHAGLGVRVLSPRSKAMVENSVSPIQEQRRRISEAGKGIVRLGGQGVSFVFEGTRFI